MHFPIMPGDTGDDVTTWQQWFNRAYSSYAPPVTGVFDAASTAATIELQRRLGLSQTGHFNIQTAKASEYIGTPLFFTVEGHMSDMFSGPVADTATQLESEGLCHHQPTGYDNGKIPFDNASGVAALAANVSATVMPNGIQFLPGTPWVLGTYSQGGIVGYDFHAAYLAPGKPLAWREADRLGTLAYGNPCRATDSIAPWAIGQITKTGTHGLDPYKRYGLPGCPAVPPNFMDDYREGDIFAENGDDQSSQLKASIYQAVARGDFLSNPYGVITELVHQLPNVLSENIPALITFGIGVFQAIVSGISFLADNPNPHYSPYDISGGLTWTRNLLS